MSKYKNIYFNIYLFYLWDLFLNYYFSPSLCSALHHLFRTSNLWLVSYEFLDENVCCILISSLNYCFELKAQHGQHGHGSKYVRRHSQQWFTTFFGHLYVVCVILNTYEDSPTGAASGLRECPFLAAKAAQ